MMTGIAKAGDEYVPVVIIGIPYRYIHRPRKMSLESVSCGAYRGAGDTAMTMMMGKTYVHEHLDHV